MTAFIKGVMDMKCGHKEGRGGVKCVLMTTQRVREISEPGRIHLNHWKRVSVVQMAVLNELH